MISGFPLLVGYVIVPCRVVPIPGIALQPENTDLGSEETLLCGGALGLSEDSGQQRIRVGAFQSFHRRVVFVFQFFGIRSYW